MNKNIRLKRLYHMQNKAHDMADKYCDLVEYDDGCDHDDIQKIMTLNLVEEVRRIPDSSINSILDSQRRVMQEYPSYEGSTGCRQGLAQWV